MNKITLISRIFLGLIFFIFGLNGFFNFIPMDSMPPMSEKAMALMGGMMGSGYFMPFTKGVEVLSGAFLLTGAFVPLALVMLAPIVIHIVLFHAFLAPASGLPMCAAIVVLMVYLSFFAQPYAAVIKQIFSCPMNAKK